MGGGCTRTGDRNYLKPGIVVVIDFRLIKVKGYGLGLRLGFRF